MRQIVLIAAVTVLLSSCSLFRRHVKYGCPANGRSLGAEKLVSGDPKAVKLAKKAKWRGG
jgi:hypothetical protein